MAEHYVLRKADLDAEGEPTELDDRHVVKSITDLGGGIEQFAARVWDAEELVFVGAESAFNKRYKVLPEHTHEPATETTDQVELAPTQETP